MEQTPLTALELEQLLDQASIIALDGHSSERYVVLERLPYRLLVLNGSVQSVQNTQNPSHLLLAHQKPLLSFLKKIPQTAQVLELGLGGGSAMRYAREFFPKLQWLCIERSATIISLYFDYFAPDIVIPNQSIMCDEAYTWLTKKRNERQFDLLLCDVYNRLDESFLSACADAVKPGGYLAVNWLPHLQEDSYGQEVISQCAALKNWPYEKEKIQGFRNRVYLFQRPENS